MKHSDFLNSLKTLKSRFLKIQKKQHFFHTATNENKETIYCTCKDSSGESKYLYTSKKELEYMLSSNAENLHAYHCPYEKGWHLTKT